MKEAIKQMLTGRDNSTHDVARWLAVLAFLTGLGLAVFSVVVKGQAFDLQQFGIGVGALFTGFGVALKLKEGTEP